MAHYKNNRASMRARVRALRDEAWAAGDVEMAATCIAALDGDLGAARQAVSILIGSGALAVADGEEQDAVAAMIV